jgi:hypothetical protein
MGRRRGVFMREGFARTAILGWSATRYEKFLLCKRQYYYEYYGRYDKEYPKEKIDFLRTLTSVPLEVGSITHDVIKVVLTRLRKTNKQIDMKRFWDFTKRKVEERCREGRFQEVYYKEIPEISSANLFKEVKEALERFLVSPRFQWLREEAFSWKEKWLIEPSGYGETRLCGMKMYCKVDFLFPIEREIYIIDWKTGRPLKEKHKKQLLGYVSWASYHFRKDPMEILPVIIYLRPSYEEFEMRFNEYDIQEFAIRVREETEEMYAFCRNIDEDIPKEKEEFRKTLNTKICDRCNYRELCREESL